MIQQIEINTGRFTPTLTVDNIDNEFEDAASGVAEKKMVEDYCKESR